VARYLGWLEFNVPFQHKCGYFIYIIQSYSKYTVNDRKRKKDKDKNKKEQHAVYIVAK